MVFWGHVLYFVFFLQIEFDHALGASVMWHLSFSLMNSFNKTEAAIFHVQSELKVLSSKRFSERIYEARQCYIIVIITWRDVQRKNVVNNVDMSS